jgi:hypothetical protein
MLPTDHRHEMWAELEVRNNRSNTAHGTEVRVADVITEFEWGSGKKGERNRQPLRPRARFNLCWSELNAAPNQTAIDIPSGATRTLCVAFCDDTNGDRAVYCTPNRPHYEPDVPIVYQQGFETSDPGGARVILEVACRDFGAISESFFFQCHPNYAHSAQEAAQLGGGVTAAIEFVLWEDYESGQRDPRYRWLDETH